MARADRSSSDDLRRAIERERDELARAAESLRGELRRAADVSGRVRERLPLAAAGALGVGFLLGGGLGATMRYVARRGREGTRRARLGRFAVVERE